MNGSVPQKVDGHKKKYQQIDFYKIKISLSIVCAVEYNHKRSVHVSAADDFNIYTVFLHTGN